MFLLSKYLNKHIYPFLNNKIDTTMYNTDILNNKTYSPYNRITKCILNKLHLPGYIGLNVFNLFSSIYCLDSENTKIIFTQFANQKIKPIYYNDLLISSKGNNEKIIFSSLPLTVHIKYTQENQVTLTYNENKSLGLNNMFNITNISYNDKENNLIIEVIEKDKREEIKINYKESTIQTIQARQGNHIEEKI